LTPVRPTSLPIAPQTGASLRPDAARAAAQRAFFQAALGGQTPTAARAPTPAAPAATTTTPTVFAQPVQRIPDPAAGAPTRILRPGSLLDIRV
jgi:hypothetical protein